MSIGDFLTESKIETTAPSADNRIRVRLNAEGVEKRPLMAEAKGATRYFKRSAGQFIYGKQNLHKGAFGIVPPELDNFESTSDLPAFDIADGLRPKWLEYFLKQGDFYKSLVSIARGAATKRIQPDALFAVKLPLPSLEEQDTIIQRMNGACAEHSVLLDEITHQRTLLDKLKQAILQEAIQGKLTADWRAANPDVEPASELLQRIQAEKARLIAEKKIRKENPLPEITPEEIPFEIPDGWKWCRLGDLSEKTGSGSTPSGGKSAYTDTGIPFLRSQNVYNAGLILNGVAHIPNSTHERMKGTKVYPDDLLLNITGGSIGRCAVVTSEIDEANINQHVAIIRPIERPLNLFLHCVIISPYFQTKIEDAQTGAGREGLPKNKMDRILIPVPSSQEQAAIVERVEALMATCRELEAEIERSRTHAADLLQAVLKEAFAPAAND